MKSKICILLNRFDEFNFADILERYLPRDVFEVVVADCFPDDYNKFDLIVPWNYRKPIRQAESAANVVVFHASNLPHGRGWAPLYYTFYENQADYVLSGILASDRIDSGDIIVQARFPIEPDYTADFLRGLDNELMLLLSARIAKRFHRQKIIGSAQQGTASYRTRRSPADSEVNPHDALINLLPHLRGVSEDYPAFFYHQGVKYFLEIKPAIAPAPPGVVEIYYYDNGECEQWGDWHACSGG